MAEPTRMIITGVPNYAQDYVTLDDGTRAMAGCGPVAALMLLAWYDRRYGFKKLIPSARERDPLPTELVLTLRKLMNTVNLELDNDGVQEYGMTVPSEFRSGLASYVGERYAVDISTKASTGLNTLEGVFEKSVALIREGRVHVICFDWQGTAGIFPNHYAVVVGYTTNNGRENLIINPGWGYSFQAVEMSDPKVKPARLYWIDIKENADGPRDGHPIGPMDDYGFQTLAGGGFGLAPTIRPHFDQGSASTWRVSDRMENGIDGSNLWQCKWFD